MHKISFFTSVSYNPSSTFAQAILEGVDGYFHLGGVKAQAHPNFIKGSAGKRVTLENVECSFLMIALKVASYFTLIFPLIMLVAKVILRCSHDFYLMSDWDRDMLSKADMIQGDPEAANIYFFGDTHSEKWHPKFGEIINQYAKEGDVFLIEGTQSLKSVENHAKELRLKDGVQLVQSGFGIQKKVEMFGWDDEQKVKKQLNFALGSIEATSDADKKKLLLERDKLVEDRNQDLIKTISYFRKNHPKKKIFVQAGRLHMFDEEREYSIIDHFKNEHCFLILPKVTGFYTKADDEQYVRKQCQLSNRKFA